MLKKILEVDPAKRMTPYQIMDDPWMQMTDPQASQVEVFSDYEKQKIVSEFEYYNLTQENANDDPFLE